MKRLAIILVLAASVCFGQTKAKDTSGAWINSKVEWQLDDFHKNKKWAQTEVLYFFEDGRFGIIDSSISQTDDEMEISYGDAQTIYFGRWRRTGAGITATYKLIYRDVPCRNGAKEPKAQQEHLAVHEDGEIVFRGLTFRKEPRLDASAASSISEKLPSGKPGDR
jgi:hypothetical protein